MSEDSFHADEADESSTTDYDLAAVRENRGALEDLASSDLSVSHIAEALLDAADAERER